MIKHKIIYLPKIKFITKINEVTIFRRKPSLGDKLKYFKITS